MSFKTFIYYCALCGAWVGFVTWAISYFVKFESITSYTPLISGIIAGLLGLLLAGVVGLMDGLLNSTGFQRILRVVLCLIVGFIGSFIAGTIGQYLSEAFVRFFKTDVRTPGWMMVGVVIGVSIGVFDLLRAAATGKGMGQAMRKTINGVIGGAIGGFVGGALNDVLGMIPYDKDMSLKDKFDMSSVATGMVIVGLCIGLLIGLAQVLLKEAWVKVESGFKAGREMILSKPETVVGRAEGCDIALFGDNGVEKQHAKIVLSKDRYVLLDGQTPGGTFINGQRISGPTPLNSGDAIQVGRSVLRFEERAKRR